MDANTASNGMHLLSDLAIILCIAAVTTVVFQRIRQPVILGYLLAGMIVGPHLPIPIFADEKVAHTLSELGVKGVDVATWYALYVTAGTPRPAVDTLIAGLAKILKQPDVQARIKGMGGEVGSLTMEQFADMNRQEFERFRKLVKDANIKVDGS